MLLPNVPGMHVANIGSDGFVGVTFVIVIVLSIHVQRMYESDEGPGIAGDDTG